MLRRQSRRSSIATAAPAPAVAPAGELLDISIDMHYARVNCKDPEAYAREPWKHSRDAPNTYLSIREKKRKEFLDHLARHDPRKRNRVQHEIDRIKQTRVNFAAYPGRDVMIKELHKARIAWRDEVIERRDGYIRETQKSRAEKDQKAKGLKGGTEAKKGLDAEVERLDRDLALLGRLKDWKADDIHETDQAPVEVEVEKLYGFKASVMYFEKSNAGWSKHSSDDPRFAGASFPNQKLLVSRLLEDEQDNLLSESSKPDCLRYFHFPTNNMSWIEKAIARYYDEKHQEFDEFKGYDTMTRAEKLLSREYWRGQMHGSRGEGRHGLGTGVKGPVHARHMRPRCSIIPRPRKLSEELSTDDPLKPKKDIALFLPYLHWEMSSRRAKMNEVIKEATVEEVKPHKLSKPGFVSIVKEAHKKQKQSNKSGWKLGNYLMKLAQVADAIDYEADERLLRENINYNPPLHTRRTLDQYYFLTLEDTSTRDKDQVVFRGTRAGRSFHTKNTRIVMVDQLWLWILGDNTIITSFPRRWGRNKPDPSGVHKSLRERLLNMNEEIKSIHHLALIIIDQCSRVFFDRTKPLDERPEVMDLFAAAIGHVTELTAIAYEGFWRNTALQAMNLLPGENDSVKHRFLDINPEGTLLRESQDIAEELKIMLRIYNEQIAVVKEFRRYLGELSAERKQGGGGDVAIMHRLLDLLEERSTGLSSQPKRRETMKEPNLLHGTAHEADLLLEQLKNRQAEILDLEESALRTCQQQERLLALKQQQASIVEAKAALKRADESVKQGRAIMAFTIVTIFFLPLGFFAAFFGMNNLEITGSTWMTLGSQLKYMFGLSAIVIVIAVSVAFSNWARAVLELLVRVPLVLAGEYSGLQEAWRKFTVDSRSLERRSKQALDDVSKRRQDRRKREIQALRDALAEKANEEGRMRTITSSGGRIDSAMNGHDRSNVSMLEEAGYPKVALEQDSTALSRLWSIIPRRRLRPGTEPYVV